MCGEQFQFTFFSEFPCIAVPELPELPALVQSASEASPLQQTLDAVDSTVVKLGFSAQLRKAVRRIIHNSELSLQMISGAPLHVNISSFVDL